MAFQSALISGQYTKLRGNATTPATYACAQHVTVLRPVIELKCRVNGTPNGTSFAAINYDTVSVGAYTDVLVGETLLIAHEDNIRKAHFVGRVRSITGSTINLNETSAGVIDNDFVWVIRDWRLMIKLAREVSGVQYKDWDVAFSGQKPIIYDLKSAYADWVDDTTGKLRISFAPGDFAAQSGATISSRAWSTLPSGATLVSGSLSGANITVDFDPGDYFLHYTVTDSGGRAQVRHIPVFAHDDTNPPALTFTGASIQNSAAAWAGSLRAFADVDDLLDGTLVVVWNEEYYNGARGSIYDNIAGVYRLRRENLEGRSDATYAYDSEVGFELEDIAAQLARLSAPLLAIRNVGSPAVWDEIASLTPYRAIIHILETGSTFHTIHSLSFDSFDTTFAYDAFPTAGSLLTACQDIAKSINAVLEFGADGRCIVSRDARYLDSTARSALPIIGAFTDGSGGTLSDVIDVTLVHADSRDVGRVDGSGGTYNTSTGQVDAYIAIAPGAAQEGGDGKQTLTGQILTANSASGVAKAELINRAAQLLEIANAPYRLIITHPDGYHWLTPSVTQWYTFELSDTLALRGLTFNTATRWLLESVTLEQDNSTGTTSVRAVYVIETYGYGGIAFEAPKPGEITPYLPDLPSLGPYDTAFPELPSLFLGDNPAGVDVPPGLSSPPTTGSAVVPRDGNAAIIWDDGHVWVTRQFLKSANPPWTDVTPDTTHTVKYADFDPFPDAQGHVGAYVLTVSSGTSYVWHCADVFAGAPDWSQGSALPGTYTMLRTTSTKGGVLIYGPDIAAGSNTLTFDFTQNNGGWQYTPPGPSTWSPAPSYLTGQGWTYGTEITSGNVYYREVNIIYYLSGTVTAVSMTFDLTLGTTDTSSDDERYINVSGNVTSVPFSSAVNGNNQMMNWSGSQVASAVILRVNTSRKQDGPVAGGSALIKSASITYDYGGGATVRYSSTYGQTWSGEVSVGTSPGSSGGFDRIVIGNTSLAAADAQVEAASTLGGSYSNEANGAVAGTYPLAILIPSHKQNSTSLTNYNAAQPEYVLATPALVSGASVWWVKPAGKTDITPTITGNKGLAVSPDCLASWRGTLLAALLSFAGTRHLIVSINGGTNWTDRGAVGANANCIKTRRRAISAGQLFFTDSAVVKYSANQGASIVSKTTPATVLKGVEAWG